VALLTQGAVIEPVNLAPVFVSPSPAESTTPAATANPSATARPTASPSPSASTMPPRKLNSNLAHPDALAWSPDSTRLAIAINGGIQVYGASGKDGDPPVAQFPAGGGVTSIDWSAAIPDHSLADVKPATNPQTLVDALLAATKLPGAADTPQNRPLTSIYVWAFDSSKPSPIAAIADATEATLAKYPPIAAIVDYHHWTAQGAWPLTGGCIRYRVVITGSIPPVASTFGLESNAPCNAPATPSPAVSTSAKPS
jgi:hypothetical protein